MRKLILFAALVSLTPAVALAMGGMGGYGGGTGGGNYGMGNSMLMNQGREDLETGLRLIQKQDYAGSIPYLRRALRLYQGNADILNYLGFASRMVGNYDDSLDYYQRALARNPDHKGAHEYLGELYLMLHKPDDARGQLAELTRLCPDGCIEKDTLTQSIASYDAAAAKAANPMPNGSAAPAATSQMPAPQSPGSQQSSTPGQQQ